MSGALVIGGGPAGLMAAGAMASAGHFVTVAEAKPSVGRKFLMAGKSGLNLTKESAPDAFLRSYSGGGPDWPAIIGGFGPGAVQDWARGLGQEVFTGSSGRVFPSAMKASPLLRAWLARLKEQGVQIRTRWCWQGWAGDALRFDTPEGPRLETPDVTVLALGGASWARLGSDAAWVPWLAEKDVKVTPFQASNAGLRVAWSPHMRRHFGAPLKSVVFRAGDLVSRGEAIVSARGLEGGGIYALTSALRNGAGLNVDLLPGLSPDGIAERMARARGKDSLSNRLRKALGLSPAKIALALEFGRPDPVPMLKRLVIPHDGPQEIDGAISTAGGIAFDALDHGLMLREMPGVFCAGEMLDWDAPTGGYLLTACFATGAWAGRHASAWQR